ncbi:Zn(II)2Cys6 transcription factor [Aspergillus lucknowensis]|uniref:Zn(2)-C6 fungal-type domain-containing protein n=1 Tax=Aspergillus lucknowensis TaxID=176173 RepID=A0ABR4M7K8_9EURO
MVYCGKPSGGCHACRARKIWCDQARPACSQCTAGDRVCPGYRDTLSLMFRDESQRVIQKATKRSAAGARTQGPPPPRRSSRAAASSHSSEATPATPATPAGKSLSWSPGTESSEDNSSSSSSSSSSSHSPALQPSYQPTQAEAISWFLRHSAWPGALFVIDFDPEILAQTNMPLSEQARIAGIVSLGTAMLARVRQSAPLRETASQEYSRALGLLTRAVSNEQQSRANATLSAVLLLALFEVVTSRDLGTMEKWTSHIYGASALLELRGQQELQDAEALKLFIQLRFQIIISCVQRGLRVPRSLLECNKLAMYLRPQMEAHCDRVIYIIGQLANLRADIFGGILTDTREILSRAYSMEADLIAWIAVAPSQFLYTTIEHPAPNYWMGTSAHQPPLYNNRYHLYHDLWVCHTWNQYRCARIMLCEIILSCLRQLFRPSSEGSYSYSYYSKDLQRQIVSLRRTSRDLAQDICASAPYHFGADSLNGAGEHRGIPASQTYIGGMLLLMPLAIVAGTEGKAHPIRRWVVECLKVIGHGMGIDQAFAIIEMLDIEAGLFEDLDETAEGGFVFLDTDRARHNRILVGAWSSMGRGQ